ncbi:uncharacterized protein LOC108050222 [Drosophila rhopaloa]|uniref:Uncharacterized protein LOC108050222 n=1 Tax=Drosophila rhopaloa TaxID=1041015 RepID=A0A6P4FDM2_DRORH|nr:uncharacterized protein LOC108050222 [Drosophila rhopaloa]
MQSRYFAIVDVILLFLYQMHLMESRGIEFTNINCTTLDKEFCDFEYCYLKAINRTYKPLSLKVRLYKTPVTKFSINIYFHKRSNGLMPISHNITVDGCKLISEMKNPLVSFLFGMFKAYSNINHACPYDHDIIVDKLPTQFVYQQFTGLWIFPEGEYVYDSNWIAYGKNRANVRVHISYT